MYVDTRPSTPDVKTTNVCAPGNPLHLPVPGTCVLTRFYTPAPSKKGLTQNCYSAYWRSDASGKYASAAKDGALMLIGCGVDLNRKFKCIDSANSKLPGGSWGVPHQ
jgi:hypothetical protein